MISFNHLISEIMKIRPEMRVPKSHRDSVSDQVSCNPDLHNYFLSSDDEREMWIKSKDKP